MKRLVLILLLVFLTCCSETKYEQVKCKVTGIGKNGWDDAVTYMISTDGELITKRGVWGEVGESITLKLKTDRRR